MLKAIQILGSTYSSSGFISFSQRLKKKAPNPDSVCGFSSISRKSIPTLSSSSSSSSSSPRKVTLPLLQGNKYRNNESKDQFRHLRASSMSLDSNPESATSSSLSSSSAEVSSSSSSSAAGVQSSTVSFDIYC